MNRNRGFTLVEVIVVLVILAILAALLIPAMTGWIDRARNAQLIADCRSCVLAVQGLATEHYVDGIGVDLAEAKQLAEVKGDISDVSMRGAPAATVEHLTYTLDGRSITYCGAPDSCSVHSETYTIGAASGGASASAQYASMGDGMKDAFDTLPTRLQYRRIDSTALNTPGSAASEIYAAMSEEQRKTLEDCVWCTMQQPEGFRIYFAPKSEAVAGSTFTLYKYDPSTGKFQVSSGGGLDSKGLLVLPSGWGSWVDTID